MSRENAAPAAGAAPRGHATIPGTHDGIHATGIHGPNLQGPGVHGPGPQGQPTDGNVHAIINQFGGLGINHGSLVPSMIPFAAGDGRFYHYTAAAGGLQAPGIPAFGYTPMSDAYYGGPYLAQGGYQPHPPFGVSPYTPAPARQAISHPRAEAGSRDVPGLDIRRSSYSTNESTPATPFLGGMASRDNASRVTVFDRSAYTTPSPQQVMAGEDLQEPKTPVLDRAPLIPFAVPAVFTPPENMHTLEQSLVNPIPGNRNVYIRGLHPTTDDELLLKYAERFGRVEISKAIIDSSTGACKGFGFAKFYDVRDSEMCIKGFYRRGYEVGFARVPGPCSYPHTHSPNPNSPNRDAPHAPPHTTRVLLTGKWLQESFNSRLRAEGDPSSTNLYLSNLPKSYGEMEINAIFNGYKILSSKVLRDSLGNSRGVGFARFETREICEQVMDNYIGRLIGNERLPLQIRYADTPRQKDLKRITAERRQFRTNEYNVSAYGTALVGISPSGASPHQPLGQAGRPGHGIAYGAGNGGAGQGVGGHGNRPRHRRGLGTLGTEPGDDGLGEGGDTPSPLVAHGSSHTSPAKQTKRQEETETEEEIE
ncbi:hypothetical protein GGR54DRAFT_654990 [Hypoxylon sp. NC1633]|nr:hypothetical protein GGR54DRAFT_654990 [Hypoxylon sp. NC1633]